jgi:hypothetical protein
MESRLYSGELDFWPYIEWGEAVAPLKNPALFSTAHVGSRGRSLEWIGPDGIEIDFCADALRMDLEGLRERPRRRNRSFGLPREAGTI